MSVANHGRAPHVSVVMPVYRVERYVGEAVDSVLRQTWRDFELIVVDDASPDHSMQVVAARTDPRIRIVRHERNQGPAAARNSGMAAARGAFIALLDADDIAEPRRLAIQIDALTRHPQWLGCGGGLRQLGPDGKLFGMRHRPPLAPEATAATALFHNTFFTSTLMMRTDVMRSLRFRCDFPMAEDFEFMARALRLGPVGNVDADLVRYRIHGGSLTATQPQRMAECVQRICQAQLEYMGLQPDAAALATHHHAGHLSAAPSLPLLDDVHAWLLRLRAANRAVPRYQADAFDRVLGQRWFEVCTHVAGLGPTVWRRWRHSELAPLWTPPAVRLCAFAFKSALRKDFRQRRRAVEPSRA